MATNVFGNPITISTLQGMVEYQNKKEITRLDLATVALNMKNARGNDFNVRQFVENIDKNLTGTPSTLCVIYNATGGTLTFVSSRNWLTGRLANSPFPVTIANGQWAGFVHICPSPDESRGPVVYRGRNATGVSCDFLLAWKNPPAGGVAGWYHMVWTEIRNQGSFDERAFTTIHDMIANTREGPIVHTANFNGCTSSAATGRAHKGNFVEAVFALEGADVNV